MKELSNSQRCVPGELDKIGRPEEVSHVGRAFSVGMLFVFLPKTNGGVKNCMCSIMMIIYIYIVFYFYIHVSRFSPQQSWQPAGFSRYCIGEKHQLHQLKQEGYVD